MKTGMQADCKAFWEVTLFQLGGDNQNRLPATQKYVNRVLQRTGEMHLPDALGCARFYTIATV